MTYAAPAPSVPVRPRIDVHNLGFLPPVWEHMIELLGDVRGELAQGVPLVESIAVDVTLRRRKSADRKRLALAFAAEHTGYLLDRLASPRAILIHRPTRSPNEPRRFTVIDVYSLDDADRAYLRTLIDKAGSAAFDVRSPLYLPREGST